MYHISYIDNNTIGEKIHVVQFSRKTNLNSLGIKFCEWANPFIFVDWQTTRKLDTSKFLTLGKNKALVYLRLRGVLE